MLYVANNQSRIGWRQPSLLWGVGAWCAPRRQWWNKKRHNFAKTLFSVFITSEELCFREKKSFKIMQSSGKITIIFGKVIELVLIDS